METNKTNLIQMAPNENGSDITSVAILWTINVCTFMIGIFLHVRIIIVSKNEKGLTWKLDVTNSALCIAHFSHTIFLHAVTYAVEDFYTYTGVWYCYVAKEIRHYGFLVVTGHSLVISVMKYTLIVHWKKVRNFGKEKVKEIFFFVNFLHPIFTIALHFVIRPDFFWVFDNFKEIDLCLGDPKKIWEPGSNVTQIIYHDLCMTIAEPDPESYLEKIIYIVRGGCCWIQVISIYLIIWNFFEMLCYCSIFGFMRR